MYEFLAPQRVDSNNADQFKADLMAAYNEKGQLRVDASQLQYISSAGLRALLALRKLQGELEVFNVSIDVKDIFDVTGFSDILTVKKMIKQISVEGCKLIGEGGNGKVYRISDDSIVKVYREGISLEEIEKELAYARGAFVAGIPTAIPFEMVKVGESYGNVYELMNSDTLSHTLNEHPERFDELMDKYVELFKTFGNTHVNSGSYEKYSDTLLLKLERLRGVYEEQDIELLEELIKSMRDTDTLVHGDFHPGNIMLQGDDLMVIDMADVTTGSSIQDIVCLYRDMGEEKEGPVREYTEHSVGMKTEDMLKFWHAFLDRYLGTTDPAAQEKFLQPVKMMYALNCAIMIAMSPAEMQKMIAPGIKKNVIDGVLRPYKDVLKGILSTM